MRPAGHHPDEIMTMLDAVPDLRPALNAPSDEELVEIFRAFDLTITTTSTSSDSTSRRRSRPSFCPSSPPTKTTAPRDGRRLTTT
jgi:hypothetical protein